MPGPFTPRSVVATGIGNSLLLYTSPTTGAGSALALVQLTNDTAGALTGRVRLVPKNAAEGAVHAFIPSTVLPAGDVLEKTGAAPIAPGDQVYVAGDAGLVFTLCGLEL